jgi:transaldolase/glucose-6-phosphate isomerase
VNPLLQLRDAGQSVWLDFIERRLVSSGELARLVGEDGLGGLTSNPTIFEKAMTASADYDDQFGDVLRANPAIDTQSLFEALAIEDIRAAADVLRTVYDATGGNDGFVSFEVSASVAGDTARTTAEARRLWKTIARPNLMIKVPATPAGIPAIEQLIADGINVNITLMFSLEHYEQVAQAYLRGLARCGRPEGVRSVASFFVSRVDTEVDARLERLGTPAALALRGRTAIANSKVVYRRFREIFDGTAFAALRARGCRVQRPLWASTSTKNPAYRDVVYVEELVGADTVNTMPPATVAAFREHGIVRGAAVAENVEGAVEDLRRLREAGVDLDQVTRDLQVQGVAAFAKSYGQLVAALEARRAAAVRAERPGQVFDLGQAGRAVAGRLSDWQRGRLCERIWAKDHTAWTPAPVPELTDRLGWLTTPRDMRGHVADLSAFAEEARAAGIRHVVLLGMGGSSLAPEVFQATFGPRAGYPQLLVLDSTHPSAVRAVERAVDLGATLFLVSSKSGTTSETNSFFQYFWSCYESPSAGGPHFVAITDPGTSLERLAHERGFRRVFGAPPDVGGRYSALTVFGLVPAALIGVDLSGLLDRATRMADAASACAPADANACLALGAALGELARAGRDKLTFLVEPALDALPAWLEQLIAESTGKEGKGIVPVADEPLQPAAFYGHDRAFVSIGLSEGVGRRAGGTGGRDELLAALSAAGHPVIRITLGSPLDLGAEFFRWEFAVAASGAVLGIQPFDQPDVQLAKELARRAMGAGAQGGAGDTVPPVVTDPRAWRPAVSRWLSTASAGDYVGLQAYLAPTAETTSALQAVRQVISSRSRLATTLGYGPRFLHSTGQLHKGGPNTGLFLQLTDSAAPDIGVPETNYTFGQLIRAQAAGDAMALAQRGRRLLRIGLGADGAGALRGLASELGATD